MSDNQKIVLPSFNKAAIKAAMADPKLAAGDYRFVMLRSPSFFTGKKEGTQHVYSAMINWYPLMDPRDRNSVAKYISVSQRLVYPIAVLTEEQAALPEKDQPVVPGKDIGQTLSFFRALTGSDVFNVGSRPRKGETESDHAARFTAAVEEACKLFQELHTDAQSAIDSWCVDGRVKHNGDYVNVSFYSEDYIKSGAMAQPWSYSKVKTV